MWIKLSLTLSLLLVIFMIVNSGATPAVSTAEEAEASECPDSLLIKGKEFLEQMDVIDATSSNTLYTEWRVTPGNIWAVGSAEELNAFIQYLADLGISPTTAAVGAAAETVTGATGAAAETVMGTVGAAAETVTGATGAAAETVMDATGAAAETVMDATGAAVETVTGATGAAAETVMDATGAAVETVTGATGAAAETVMDATGAAVETVTGATGAAVETVTGATGAAVETVTGAAGTAAETVTGATGAAAETVMDAAGAAAETVTGATGAAVETVTGAAGAAAETVTGATGAAVETVTGAAGTAAETVTGAAGAAAETVTGAAGAAAETVTGAAGAAVETVTGAAGAAAETVTGAAGAVAESLLIMGSSQEVQEALKRVDVLLAAQGFEDTDGDGLLNFPPDSPFIGGENLDLVLITTETSGVVMGFVPIAGEIVDGTAIVIGKDPITGECLTQTDQILLALGIILLLPISGKGLKVIWKQIDKIPLPQAGPKFEFNPLLSNKHSTWISEFKEGVRRAIRRVTGLNRVAPAFKHMRRVVGEGAVSTTELAAALGFKDFTKSNYRQALLKFTGVTKKEAQEFEAHHILPQTFEETFNNAGINNIHDPRFLVWVKNGPHQEWSSDYNDAWRTFFDQNLNPTVSDILEEARRLAQDYKYDVLFETP